ncbi:MAG: hypothetical protein DCC52_01205 [Chloroflexi bacterium]|nr:MAG: hypothetical protein DCC52_01205 [Chloroflexota bacterium]
MPDVCWAAIHLRLISRAYHQRLNRFNGGEFVKKISVLCGAIILLMAFSTVAMAHAEMKSCTPPINGMVDTAPDKIVCTASEAMDPKGSMLAVFDAMGMQVDKKDSAVDLNDPDRATISVSLASDMMADGVYTVKWTTLSASDGDQATGEFKFTVGHGMHMSETPMATATDTTMHPNGDLSVGMATVDGTEITLKIVSPLKDAEVPAGMVTVQAALDGATLGENESHLHFYVDDNLALMSRGAQTSADLEIKEPGEHNIKVTYSDQAHDDLIQVFVRVMVVAAAQSTAAPTATMEPTMPPPTQAPAPTLAPTVAPTAEATTLPTSGSDNNFWLYAFLAGIGAGIIGAGVLAAVRARR